MLRKVVRGQKALILFLCFEAEIQFKKAMVFLKQLESVSAVKNFCKSFITLLPVEYYNLFGCGIVNKLRLLPIVCLQCPIDSGLTFVSNCCAWF